MNPNPPLRVLCVDDNRMIGDAIALRLHRMVEFEWLGQIISADDLVNEAEKAQPHIIILDIDMPGRNAFDALADLVEARPEVRVVILSGHVRKGLIERALDRGAWGYISKEGGIDTIVEGLHRIAQGELFMSRDVEEVLDS